MAKKNELNPKQKAFCLALLKHKFNQTKAYLEVYPDSSANSAKVDASRLLTNANIMLYVQKLVEELENKELITVDEIINDIKEVKNRCLQKEPVKEYNHSTKEYEETGEYQFKEQGVLKACELLGKYLAMFTDKVNVNGEQSVIVMTPEEKAAYEKLKSNE